MKILITGISGFVARHFVEYLSTLKENHELLGLYNKNRVDPAHFHYPNIRISFAKVNMMDKGLLKDTLTGFRPENVLHLASKSSIAYSWQHPGEVVEENTGTFLNLLEVIRENNLRCRILSVGSAEEYGTVVEKMLPLTEDYCLNPVNPYGVSRVLQYNLTEVYSRHFGLDIIHTRSFNHIGPYQKENFVIGSFARQIARQMKEDKSPIILTVGDIDVIRDFTDVRDVVKAYHGLLIKGVKGATYNVCTGKGYVLRDIIGRFSQLTGRPISIRVEPGIIRPFETKKVVGSNEKIRNEIGWKPEIPIEKSLSDLLDFWMKQED